MCPFTGFVNLFDFANIRTQEAKREFLKKFDSIEIKDDQIVFTFDYKNFKVRDKVSVDDLDKTSWKIYCGKPRTDYDREKKHYVYNPTPADEAIAAVSNIEDTNLAKADISKKQAEILFNLFYSTIRTSTVKKCKEVDKEYYSSPATASDNLSLSVAEVAAENMAKKMWYHMNISDDKFNDKKYLSGWLNYAQKAIA
jgi:CRISPR-associated protein Cpf1